MVMLTGLADACNRSGLRVVEVAGWRTRGRHMVALQSIILHHTATSAAAKGNMPTLGMLRDGRPDLPGPLSQLGLGRDGTVYVVAAGRANHAGATHLQAQGNSYALGIEVEHPGHKPIEGDQLVALLNLTAALQTYYAIPTNRVWSHAEIATPRGRKIDIRNNMGAIRKQLIAGELGSVATVDSARYLVVNGELNVMTVGTLQKFLHSTGGFEFHKHGGFDGKLGPYTVSAFQVHLARQGLSLGRADGVFGARSARAAERWLGQPAETVPGWYPGLGRALQRRLNIWLASG